jgi:hypothetical protein
VRVVLDHQVRNFGLSGVPRGEHKGSVLQGVGSAKRMSTAGLRMR